MRLVAVVVGVLFGLSPTVAQQLVAPAQSVEMTPWEPSHVGRSQAGPWQAPSLPLLLQGGQRPTAIQEFIFDSLVNAFSYYSWQQQPLWWDPASNVLVTLKRGGATTPAGDGNRLYYRYSTNRGQSWSGPVLVFDGNPPTSRYPRYPSVYVINQNNSSRPEDLLLVFASPVTDGTRWAGFQDGFTYVGSSDVQSWFNDGVDLTIGGSSVRYSWGTDSRITATRSGDIALTLGALVAPDGVPTAEQNYIGLRLQDFAAAPFGYVPDEWRSTLFGDPGQPGFRANVPIGIARDDAGNLIVAVFGRYQDSDDPGLPTVGFFRSRNDGDTWEGPFFLQPSAIRTYAAAQGITQLSVPFGLQTGAGGSIAVPKSFTAYGDGNVSLAFQIFDFDTAKPLEQRIPQMVEATYANGTWTLRKISDRSWLSFALVPDPNSPPSTQVGNELQLSRTADGRALLAKWIEGVVYIAQVDINGDGMAPDTFLTTDVFVATRLLPDGEWSEPVNVTQTPMWDKLAWLPPVVPNDLQQIPLLMVKTAVDTFVYPTILERLVNSQWQLLEKQYVTIATFSTVVSVPEATRPAGELWVQLAPHPVQRELRLLVRSPGGSSARIELSTLAGERLFVRHVELSAGEQMVVVPLPELAAGTYMLQLYHGGTRTTLPVVIVR